MSFEDSPTRPVATMPYSPAELAEDWEFKLIRSHFGLFARREFRDRILAEEARSGWVLLEKLDDNLLRLKRRRKSQPDPEIADIDPYRSVVDAPERSRESRIVFVALLILSIVVLVVIAFFSR